MSEYTPTKWAMRDFYINALISPDADERDLALIGEEFDRGLEKIKAEVREQTLAPFVKMVDDIREAVAWDVLAHPHGEAEYPVSYFADKLQECIDAAEDE